MVFDPEQLLHRVREKSSWWRVDPQDELEEVADGRVAFFTLGREGSYRVSMRVGDALSEQESERAVGQVSGLSLRVSSGKVFVGAAERLPGEGRGKQISEIPDTGALLDVEPGDYAVDTWVLHWRDDDLFYDEDNEIKVDAPADFVVLLGSREGEHKRPAEPPPRLLDLLPKAQTKGKAKVVSRPKRRRSIPDAPKRRRKRSSGGVDPEPVVSAFPAAPRHVPEEVAAWDVERIRDAFREVVFGQILHPPPDPAVRTLVIGPRERHLQRPDIPFDLLFKKVTRVRENLRVLEAKINGHKGLTFVQKAELEEPITGIYTSLNDLLDWLAEETRDLEPVPPPPTADP